MLTTNDFNKQHVHIRILVLYTVVLYGVIRFSNELGENLNSITTVHVKSLIKDSNADNYTLLIFFTLVRKSRVFINCPFQV